MISVKRFCQTTKAGGGMAAHSGSGKPSARARSVRCGERSPRGKDMLQVHCPAMFPPFFHLISRKPGLEKGAAALI